MRHIASACDDAASFSSNEEHSEMPGEVLTRASTAAYTIALAIGPHRSTIIAGSTAGGGCSAGCSTTWDRTARYGVRQVGSHRRDLLARGLHL